MGSLQVAATGRDISNQEIIVEQRIQKAVEKFAMGLTKEIVAVIYDDLIDDLQTQRATNKGLELKSNGNGNGKVKRRNGKTAPAKRKSAKRVSAKKATLAKRTPEQIEMIATRALAAIIKNPGQGIEALAKSLRVETKVLSLPIRKLVSDKAIRTKGERRATKYFPKAARKKTSKKATAKKK